MRHRVPFFLLALSAAAALTGCSLTPTEADPVQVRLTDLDARVAKVERIIANQSLVELSQRVEALEAGIRDLRGRTEVQENAVEGAKKQQRDLYADLDQRLAALEAGIAGPAGVAAGAAAAGDGVPAAAPAGAPVAATLPAADPQRSYDTAFAALKDARYAEAITGFRGLLEASPASPLAPNAQYWLGEAYYVTRDYESAAGAFDAVGQRWPDSAKAPGALLKLGYAQYELKRYLDAKQTFARLVARYPDTEAAKLAQERMKRLIAEGQ
ncbi:MAG: tol-pal system protein YbgF [Steroidobacteraceae bacterium]